MHKNLLISLILAGSLATPALAGTPVAPVGAVYAMTNDTDANAVLVFDRYADGHLAYSNSYRTGGQGGLAVGPVDNDPGDPADPLGSENSLILDQDKSWL